MIGVDEVDQSDSSLGDLPAWESHLRIWAVPYGRSSRRSGPESRRPVEVWKMSSLWSRRSCPSGQVRFVLRSMRLAQRGRVVEYTDLSRLAMCRPVTLSLLRRRGCVVVQGHFEHEQALDWDRQIVDYVDSNGFFESYREPGDDFFTTLNPKPEILIWSPPQMQARQSERMANVQRSSTHSGTTNQTARNGSSRIATSCTRIASGVVPKARPPVGSVPTSTPAPSTCG